MLACMPKELQRIEQILDLIASELYIGRIDRDIRNVGVRPKLSPDDSYERTILEEHRARLVEEVDAMRAALKGR